MDGPTVKVFTAGDHFQGYDKPEKSSEFVEALLQRCGYTKPYTWECRVDKLKHCSGESRPIRIVGFKNYGVILRVKPYLTAAIDFQMTLYIPTGSGYSAKNLFDQLKANEKSISRSIRQQEKKETQVHTTTVSPVKIHTPEETVIVEEYRPEFKTLQAVVKTHDKLKYILNKIKTVNAYDFCRNKVQFTETLRHECKWDKENHSKGAVGRVLSELVKHDYLMEVINERDKIIGYTITEKAEHLLKNHTIVVQPPKQQESRVNIPLLLVSMREKLQELADVANKINTNNLQKAEFLEKISALDKENEELSQVMSQSKEVQDVLDKLGQLVVPLPIRTA